MIGALVIFAVLLVLIKLTIVIFKKEKQEISEVIAPVQVPKSRREYRIVPKENTLDVHSITQTIKVYDGSTYFYTVEEQLDRNSTGEAYQHYVTFNPYNNYSFIHNAPFLHLTGPSIKFIPNMSKTTIEIASSNVIIETGIPVLVRQEKVIDMVYEEIKDGE